MRLIDADKLLRNLMEEIPMAENVHIFKDIIDNQPTAYDVTGVTNTLAKDKFTDVECILSDVHQGYNAGLNRAIEIVKGGGVE